MVRIRKNQNGIARITGWEIVPWRPAPPVVLLQAFPFLVEARRRAMNLTSPANKDAPHKTNSDPTPVIILSKEGIVQDVHDEDSGPIEFEIQMEEMRPSPEKALSQEKRPNPEEALG